MNRAHTSRMQKGAPGRRNGKLRVGAAGAIGSHPNTAGGCLNAGRKPARRRVSHKTWGMTLFFRPNETVWEERMRGWRIRQN